MNTADIQDLVLNTTRRERIPVTVHLTNGVPLKGIIRGFDNYVVIIEGDGKQMMVYKHAISTITPLRHVLLNQNEQQAAIHVTASSQAQEETPE